MDWCRLWCLYQEHTWVWRGGMEVLLDQVWNRLSVLFGSILIAWYHHTWEVLTHWTCASQHQQLKCHIDGSFLLFYFTCFSVFLLSFSLPLLLMHNSLSCIDCLSSLRWHPAEHRFPPLMAAHTSLPLETLVPVPRDSSLGINPKVISICEPGAPQRCTPNALQKHLLGWGGMVPNSPSRKVLPTACLCVCMYI